MGASFGMSSYVGALVEQGIGNFVIRLEFALGFFMPGLLERWLNGWYGQLGVGTRATIAEAVKSEASGAVSGSLRDQAEASFSLSKDPGGPDFFLLDLAEKLENSVPSEEQGDSLGARALAELRYKSAEQALNLRWPTNKDEAYRFTDVRFLKNLDIAPTPAQPASVPNFESELGLGETEAFRLVFVDGVISESLSKVEGLSGGAYVGSVCKITADSAGSALSQALEYLGKPAAGTQDDLFTFLNGLGVQDAGLVFAPKGVQLSKPIHVVYYSTGRGGSKDGEEVTSISLATPRLLVVAESGARVEIIEQFVGAPDQVYWTNQVCEIYVANGAEVSHSCSQEQERSAVHIKQTHVSQGEKSTYKLVEAEVGGRLSRHNLQVIQLGSDTQTEFSTFSLSSKRQVQDLHSRLVLDHPRGISRQIHKCIVTHRLGQAVFDGNVKVNRFAQQTDAGQLSRSLLLAQGATVNVKPNLQIIADDVKCTHGAAISDLEEEQLFYFQARGIDPLTARSALVFSFGAEVLQSFGNDYLKKRLERLVKSSLATDGVVNPNVPVGQ